jgi:hypothetical protein
MSGHFVWRLEKASLYFGQIQQIIVFSTYNYREARREYIYQGSRVPIEAI